MTVNEFSKNEGWSDDAPLNNDARKASRSMVVDVDFINNEGDMDETEFTICSYNFGELNKLFSDFCKENGFKTNTVINIRIIRFNTGKE